MTNSEAGMSRDVAQPSGGVYEVFLSFRGSDTRHGFTDFLYHGLINVGVCVFRDEDELQEGEVISHNLLRAINNSILYIPIFSQNYASSKWCLRELALMVNNVSKAEGKKSLLPIFFDVEPEDVKLKTPRYSAAFLEHDKKFPTEARDWRKALEEVDEIKGWNMKEDQSQAKIVQLVTEKVLEKLETKQKSVPEDLIGLDDRVKELIELLDVNRHDRRLIAIYGMGGIGKSTVAKVVFNRLSSHFGKCCSFLDDIRENLLTEKDIVQLQKKLLYDIVGKNLAELVNDSEQGMKRIREALPFKKVLVVLDDVAEGQHIKKIIGNSSLHPGSRIIITTRDNSIPTIEEFNVKILRYEMPMMDDAHALKLFCQHAFSRGFPSDEYRGLSSEIVLGLGGLPLAIKVIGSSLKGRNKAIWEETLDSLKNIHENVHEKLKISYDRLNENQKEIFLDIACFFSEKKTNKKNFFNNEKTYAIYMWTSCGFQPQRGIQVLIERCLIKILDNDSFWMHDQLIDLGRQIVREENVKNLGKRSRLWITEEALQILGTKEIKHAVQGLELARDGLPIEITNEDFESLPNLRFLNLKNGASVGGSSKCHSKLKWFSWSNLLLGKDFRRVNLDWHFLAGNLYLEQLVVCKLEGIDLKDDSKAWDFIKRARNLKVLSIIACSGITSIPDISGCLALERLTLDGCSSLKRIERFIENLRSLIELKIEQCWNFSDLPEEVGALVKLMHFSLAKCGHLRELPVSLGNLTSLMELDLSGTGIRELPSFIGQLKSLRTLRFCILAQNSNSMKEWQLPSGIGTLVHLEELYLSGHRRMKGEIEIGELSSLKILELQDTGICGIPGTINKLHQLQTLNLINCHWIQELPELPTSLTKLHLRSRSSLSVTNIAKLTNLVDLLLSDTTYGGISNLSDTNYGGISNLIVGCDLRWIGNLSRLELLELGLLNILAPSELASLSHLKELVLRHMDLKSLVWLPSSDLSWRNLLTLRIRCCEVEDILLDGLSQLEELVVRKCERLKRLSIHSGLRKLRQVDVESCSKLVEIQVVGVSKSLVDLTVDSCDFLTRISGLSYLKSLGRLEIRNCSVLTSVEGLNELESLKTLLVLGCISLRWLIDASCKKIPDDCSVNIDKCGYFIKDGDGISFKRYREEILLSTSRKVSFTIQFHLGVEMPNEGQFMFLCGTKREKEVEMPIEGRFMFVYGIKREKEGVDPDSLTYEGLIADIKNFGFHVRRIWYQLRLVFQMEIQSDGDVNQMLACASRDRFLIHLFVEGGVDSEWEGEYDEEMLMEQRRMKTDVCSDEDGAKRGVSCPDEDSNSTPVGGESETHVAFSIDDFELERGNAECLEASALIAEKDSNSVKKQVELHEEPRDEETITLEHYGEEIFLNTLNKSYQLKSTSAKHGKRQRDDDHANHANTTAKNSTRGQQSSIPQHVTRRTTRQAAKKPPPIEVAALPVEAVGPSRKKKKNDSKQANPIRRSARLMKGTTGGTSDIMHLDR